MKQLIGVILLFLIFWAADYMKSSLHRNKPVYFYSDKRDRRAQWDKKLSDAVLEACQKSYKKTVLAGHYLTYAYAFKDRKDYTVQINYQKIPCVEAHVYFRTDGSSEPEFYVKMLKKGDTYEPLVINRIDKSPFEGK